MQVFVSWSGDESRKAAEALRDWLADVLRINVFVSSEDLRRGGHWSSDLRKRLHETHFGIACLTRDNLAAPWINFEMGAAAKEMDAARVVPFLLGDLSPADLASTPLSEFNAVRARDEKETFQMLVSIRESCSLAISDRVIRTKFDGSWPVFSERLRAGCTPEVLRGRTVESADVGISLQRTGAPDEYTLSVTSLADHSLYYFRWALPRDLGEWHIPPSEVELDGEGSPYPIGTFEPGRVITVPAIRRAYVTKPLHITFMWFDEPDERCERQVGCWLDS